MIADWPCEVTQAQQSEKVYSGSGQKKKEKKKNLISHSVICTGGVGRKGSHATFTHTAHTTFKLLIQICNIHNTATSTRRLSGRQSSEDDVTRLQILTSSQEALKTQRSVCELEIFLPGNIFAPLHLHFRTWQPGRPWRGHEEAFDATQQNLTGSAAGTRRGCGALAACLSASKELAPNESGSDANTMAR